MTKPYYQDEYVTLYHGDNREIAPTLGAFGTFDLRRFCNIKEWMMTFDPALCLYCNQPRTPVGHQTATGVFVTTYECTTPNCERNLTRIEERLNERQATASTINPQSPHHRGILFKEQS